MLHAGAEASMHGSLSHDLRERVIDAVVGQSRRKAAESFGVVPSTVVKRWPHRATAEGRRPRAGSKVRALVAARGTRSDRGRAREHAALGRARRARAGGDHVTVWNLLRRRGPELQKKPCTPANRIDLMSRAAGAVADLSEPDRSAAAGVHRRDLGQDQHGAAAGLGTTGPAPRSPRCRTATGRR